MRTVLKKKWLEDRLNREGWVVVPFLDPQEIAALAAVYEKRRPQMGTGFYTSLWSGELPYREEVHRSILSAFDRSLEEYFDSHRICLANFAVKRGDDTSNQVPLHQDWSIVDNTRFREISIWIPLIDVDHHNGCLAVVPRSHRFRDDVRPNADPSMHFFPFRPLTELILDRYTKSLPMKAGDAVIYDSRLLHASRANQSGKDRVAAVGVAIPREADLLHYFAVSETEIEGFQVDEDFYWKSVELGKPPANARSIGRQTYSRVPFSKEELAAMASPVEPAPINGASRPAISDRPPSTTPGFPRAFRDENLDRTFWHSGYVVLPLLESFQVAHLTDVFEGLRTRRDSGFHATMYHDAGPNRAVVYRALRSVVEPLLDRYLIDYRICLGNFMVKEPQDEASTMPVHQDWSFVDEPTHRAIHLWIPLVDVTPENGCLAVVPGSHHLGDPIRPHADAIPFLATMPILEERFLRQLPMKAGEVVFYEGGLLHGSQPNRSPRVRLACSAITVPKGAPVQHTVRINARQVETFEVDDAFFWDYALGDIPQGEHARSLGPVDYVVRQLTPEEIEPLAEYQESGEARELAAR